MRQDTYLEMVKDYWRQNRQVGHTMASLLGIMYDRPFIYIVSNSAQAQYLRQQYKGKMVGGVLTIGKAQVYGLSIIPHLKGFHLPLVVEHFAMEELIIQHTAAINKWYREKEEKNNGKAKS